MNTEPTPEDARSALTGPLRDAATLIKKAMSAADEACDSFNLDSSKHVDSALAFADIQSDIMSAEARGNHMHASDEKKYRGTKSRMPAGSGSWMPPIKEESLLSEGDCDAGNGRDNAGPLLTLDQVRQQAMQIADKASKQCCNLDAVSEGVAASPARDHLKSPPESQRHDSHAIELCGSLASLVANLASCMSGNLRLGRENIAEMSQFFASSLRAEQQSRSVEVLDLQSQLSDLTRAMDRSDAVGELLSTSERVQDEIKDLKQKISEVDVSTRSQAKSLLVNIDNTRRALNGGAGSASSAPASSRNMSEKVAAVASIPPLEFRSLSSRVDAARIKDCQGLTAPSAPKRIVRAVDSFDSEPAFMQDARIPHSLKDSTPYTAVCPLTPTSSDIQSRTHSFTSMDGSDALVEMQDEGTMPLWRHREHDERRAAWSLVV